MLQHVHAVFQVAFGRHLGGAGFQPDIKFGDIAAPVP